MVLLRLVFGLRMAENERSEVADARSKVKLWTSPSSVLVTGDLLRFKTGSYICNLM